MINHWRSLLPKLAVLAIATLVILIFGSSWLDSQISLSADLPPAKVHSLPKSLANWQDRAKSGDYFRQTKSTPLGYLVWSKFPVTVFVEKPLKASIADTAAERRFQEWVIAVRKAIAGWNVYLPLKEIADSEKADIVIWRSQPEREAKLNPDTGLFDIPRAVTAETNYKFYLGQKPRLIAHKMTIEISPSYTGESLLATARHELGHALGIWGHSSNKNDALYFSQVSYPPAISSRDINTLKKIYQQPTKLGWKI
ncbi:matrixin family metalloprotease [Pleurocapsa sp. FMAR1]|uniref:matrixin family metalloprotease n=1 Tax=Pleurocapsa sp. FMAR1 TaxID=3040204 RepID=UPI0029C7FB48|nr:matrixin family metalloprotease [Pleurocapsa sp. FMAR1]